VHELRRRNSVGLDWGDIFEHLRCVPSRHLRTFFDLHELRCRHVCPRFVDHVHGLLVGPVSTNLSGNFMRSLFGGSILFRCIFFFLHEL